MSSLWKARMPSKMITLAPYMDTVFVSRLVCQRQLLGNVQNMPCTLSRSMRNSWKLSNFSPIRNINTVKLLTVVKKHLSAQVTPDQLETDDFLL